MSAVPDRRCGGCLQWLPPDPGGRRGRCLAIDQDRDADFASDERAIVVAYPFEPAALHTTADFGCVLWEGAGLPPAKEASACASSYWNLTVRFTCPHCGTEVEDIAQTHWKGAPGSCVNYYQLGEPVAELAGIVHATAEEQFDGECSACGAWVSLSAEVQDGAMVRVWLAHPPQAACVPTPPDQRCR